MLIIVLSVFLSIFLIPVLHRILGNKTAYFLSLLPATAFVWFCNKLLTGVAKHPVLESISWNAYFDLQFSFYLDGLSLLFSLLITGIGTLIYLYAGKYMEGKPYYSRFFIYLTAFMGAMLGLVLAENLITLIVFWELTSITSFLLIGYNHEDEGSRYAARQSLLVTGSGGLALLAGLIMLGLTAETFSISEMLNQQLDLSSSAMYLPILACVLLGAFTKSAQMPFHFWLPNAMAAPTPVSAYLHSATMVKAGIYLIARFHPVLSGSVYWELTLCFFGGMTMLIASFWALKADDLKEILAYSTISALGILVFSFGIGSEAAIYAGLTYLVAHALYKSGLFMLAGTIDKVAQTRSIKALPGKLYQKMPEAFGLQLLSALSFAGIIPFLGFVAKEKLMEMTLHSSTSVIVYTVLLVLTSSFFVAVFLLLTHGAFLKKSGEGKLNSVSKSILIAPAITSIAGLLFGIFPDLLSNIIYSASAAVYFSVEKKHLALWHGFNLAFSLSLLSVGLGTLFYYFKIKWGTTQFVLPQLFYPSFWYEKALQGLMKIAETQTAFIQTGKLRQYITSTLLSIFLLTGFTFLYKSGIRINTENIDIYLFEVVLGIIIILALTFTLFIRSKIASILSLGIAGVVISIVFLVYGAPDLAITFFLIDTLTLILFVLILHKIPPKASLKTGWVLIRDITLSIGVGTTMTFILLALTYYPLASKLKAFYAQKSYVAAKGKNIVNVILVDFRALDTFGEITVLAIAAMGIYAMIYFPKNKEKRASS